MCKPGKDELDVHVLMSTILQLSACARIQKIVVFLDALDECQSDGQDDSSDFIGILEFLNKLPETSADFRTCISACTDSIFEGILEPTYVIGVNTHNKTDIRRYLETELNKIKFRSHLRPKFRAELLSTLSRWSPNMFLWAKLVLDRIQKVHQSSSGQLSLEEVKKTPEELQDLYRTLLENMGPERSKEALALLQLVQVAIKPVTVLEVKSALDHSKTCVAADDTLSEALRDLEINDLSGRIHDISGGLVEVSAPLANLIHRDNPPTTRRVTPVVQFIHTSVREF